MVTAASTPRPRSADFPVTLSGSPAQGKARRSAASWIVIAIPILMVTLFVWQVVSPLLRTEAAVRDAVGFSRVSLEADPTGSRIDFAVVDRVGRETTVDGDVNVSLREPDGTVWQTTRSITAAKFVSLPEGGLLAGRIGYSVLVPTSDWSRAPRRGGAATVSVSIRPTDGVLFSTVAEERFP
ncbi:MAG: hypothetical protein LC797_05105 [Chloroflexi bacterium]|nr:hypothetical protein [Chloroflexota bacterium]